ncbi:MAG: GAF domain-containing protein, partial [Corynebacteriales bacterium]|nr:GAF domain-containing protein [Mycobacteriales bacterium]
AAVFTASGGGRLEVLAQRGTERVAWETSIDADTPIADAWTSQQPQVATRSLVRAGRRNGVSALVLPLVTGVRTVGLVVMEVDQAGVYDRETVAQARNVAAEIALRLETALLFADVRSIATTEERQRLAREIHDGVAQELVMVGYGIDNAMAVLPKDSEAVEPLTALRAEVTRVITELRLSLFELRSDVDRLGGLGTAIAESARAIGNSAGLRVHLSLDESTARLPAAVEGELLRIAQEAITNARKHSQAHNLWVTCEVDPPYARIEIADDGRGITPREDADAGSSSYGMSIMAERAERIRALFSITPREGGGTVVSVELRGAAPARHGSVTTEQEVANSE